MRDRHPREKKDEEPDARRDSSFMSNHQFLQTSEEACESEWSTWPEMQERAIENGTVLVWNMGSSVGHYIRALIYVLPVSARCRMIVRYQASLCDCTLNGLSIVLFVRLCIMYT